MADQRWWVDLLGSGQKYINPSFRLQVYLAIQTVLTGIICHNEWSYGRVQRRDKARDASHGVAPGGKIHSHMRWRQHRAQCSRCVPCVWGILHLEAKHGILQLPLGQFEVAALKLRPPQFQIHTMREDSTMGGQWVCVFCKVLRFSDPLPPNKQNIDRRLRD